MYQIKYAIVLSGHLPVMLPSLVAVDFFFIFGHLFYLKNLS
jgi:hypothetical protein